MWFYRFGRDFCRWTVSLLYPIKIFGKENVPLEGSIMICPNHIGELDCVANAISIKRDIHFMAKKELWEVPLLKNFLTWAKAIPVNRGSVSMDTMRTGVKYLKENRALLIYPEGTCFETGDIHPGLAGAGFFVLRTNCLVVPCTIIGPHKLFKKTVVAYGKPMDMTSYRESKASPEVVVAAIMTEIKKLYEKYKHHRGY